MKNEEDKKSDYPEKSSGKKESRIKDKKRIAICGGSLGRENRSLIRGQIVDVGVPDLIQAESIIDFLTGFFIGEESQITPFKDFSLSAVRKPILSIEIYDSTEKKIYESIEITGNDDGFFTHDVIQKIKPGKYTFHVIFKGSDSYRQYTRDIAYLNLKENSDITKVTLVGKGKLRILPEKYESYITTSDIDQTYLATELNSKKGMLSTLFETPDEKFYLPGMPDLYQQLRKDTQDSPLCFISASPHFFRRTLLATIHNHEIETESLHLKYLEGTIKGIADKMISTVLSPDKLFREGVGPALDRAKKYFKSTIQSLYDQLSYKLTILLQDRLYQPTKVKEILLGDNTESDYLIFSLYQLIIMGEIEGRALEDYLYNLNFLGRDAVNRDNAKRIRSLGEECIAIHGKRNSVHLVLINRTAMGPSPIAMDGHVRNSFPPGLNIDKIKKFVWYEPTNGALGFALILSSAGVISFSSLIEVMKSMIGKWHNGTVVDKDYLRTLSEDMRVPENTRESWEKVKEILLNSLGLKYTKDITAPEE
jgi:hypothetical protein